MDRPRDSGAHRTPGAVRAWLSGQHRGRRKAAQRSRPAGHRPPGHPAPAHTVKLGPIGAQPVFTGPFVFKQRSRNALIFQRFCRFRQVEKTARHQVVWSLATEIGQVLLGQPCLTPLERRQSHARAGHRESHGTGEGWDGKAGPRLSLQAPRRLCVSKALLLPLR